MASSSAVDAGRAPMQPLVACRECDRLYVAPALAPDVKASCARCGATLFVEKPRTVQRTLALTLTALALFGLACAFPFFTVSAQGQAVTKFWPSSAQAYQSAGMPELAAVVVFATMGAPLAMILAQIWVLAPLALFDRPAPFSARAMRLMGEMREWAMPEVYLLAVLVSYVKIAGLATIRLDVGAFSFIGMIVALIWSQVAFEPRVVWERLRPSPPESPPAPGAIEGAGRVSCHACALVVSTANAGAHGPGCPRCGAALHRRKRNSVSRSWALVLAAAIFYVPANLLPVTYLQSVGGPPQADTILGGVQELIAYGDLPIASLLFFASIVVPMAKLVGLGYLLVSVQRRSRFRPKDRTRLYRVVASIGRWSMVDVFVVSVLSALVQFGALATIEPDLGVIAFCSVVIITMFAALTFDPRLIWDAAGANDGS